MSIHPVSALPVSLYSGSQIDNSRCEPAVDNPKALLDQAEHTGKDTAALCARAYASLRDLAVRHNGELPAEGQLQFFRLLEMYASRVCYGRETQGDDEVGFRESARLLEMSFCLQLKALGLGTVGYDWSSHSSLEQLVQSLEVQKGQRGRLFDTVYECNLDPEVLVRKASDVGMREVMTKTLIRMTFSHQNIDAVPSTYSWHKTMNDLTEAFIGQTGTKEKQELTIYRYNRCGFLVRLQYGDNWAKQMEAYDAVEKMYRENFAEGSYELNSGLAQIDNMRGRITLRTRKDLATAQRYFQKAYSTRQSLLARGDLSPAQLFEQKQLTANVLTGLIYCSLADSGNPHSLVKAEEYAKDLRRMINEQEERSALRRLLTFVDETIQQRKRLSIRAQKNNPFLGRKRAFR